MLSMIPFSYRILIALALLGAVFSAGATSGYKWHKAKTDAAQVQATQDADRKFKSEVARGNELSGKLAAAESAINTKTVEVIKYVKKYTTGRDCLSPGAVGLLNYTGPGLNLPIPAGQPAPESPAAPSATDSDVYLWIAAAHGRYDTCAERLNQLVDWEEGK